MSFTIQILEDNRKLTFYSFLVDDKIYWIEYTNQMDCTHICIQSWIKDILGMDGWMNDPLNEYTVIIYINIYNYVCTYIA